VEGKFFSMLYVENFVRDSGEICGNTFDIYYPHPVPVCAFFVWVKYLGIILKYILYR
jgi:hypothetical protein